MDRRKSIQEIIQGCLREDPEAQRALVDRYADRLYAICLRYMGGREKAQDSLQESLIRIFKYIGQHDTTKGSFDAWINTITIRQCLKMLKSKSMVDFNDITESSVLISEDPTIIDQLHTDQLLSIIQELPDGYRQIFNLHVIEGYSHKEIAEHFDIEEVSSRSKLSRAKTMLREKLEHIKKQESWIKVG